MGNNGKLNFSIAEILRDLNTFITNTEPEITIRQVKKEVNANASGVPNKVLVNSLVKVSIKLWLFMFSKVLFFYLI